MSVCESVVVHRGHVRSTVLCQFSRSTRPVHCRERVGFEGRRQDWQTTTRTTTTPFLASCFDPYGVTGASAPTRCDAGGGSLRWSERSVAGVQKCFLLKKGMLNYHRHHNHCRILHNMDVPAAGQIVVLADTRGLKREKLQSTREQRTETRGLTEDICCYCRCR